MRFLLDTDTVSFALRGAGRVAEHLLDHRPSEIAVSAVSIAELRYGAEKRQSRRLHRLIDQFLSSVEELPFDSRAAHAFARVAASLETAGRPIGFADTMIAGHAIARNLTLVSHNTRHFSRIEKLALTDWF